MPESINILPLKMHGSRKLHECKTRFFYSNIRILKFVYLCNSFFFFNFFYFRYHEGWFVRQGLADAVIGQRNVGQAEPNQNAANDRLPNDDVIKFFFNTPLQFYN